MDPVKNDSEFLRQVNQNIAIAMKVCTMYFHPLEHDDLEQEMMYQLWSSYPRFDGRSKFTTWMYRVCLNTALTWKRKVSKRKIESLTDQHLNIAAPPASDKEAELRLLHEAIRTLSDVNKAVVLLYLDNMSYEEIAEITGLTKANVSVRLVRIKKELETIVKEKLKMTDL